MPAQIIIVSNQSQSEWLFAVTKALESLGSVQVMSENDTLEQIIASSPTLIIADASTIKENLIAYVNRLHHSQPDLPILIVTASPTWWYARSLFRAGASDYIRKSFDINKITAICKELLAHSVAGLAVML